MRGRAHTIANPLATAIAIAGAALIAAGAAACKKDEGDRTGNGTEQSAGKADPMPAELPPAQPGAAREAAAGAAEPSAAPTSEEQATAEKAAAALEELGKIAEGAKGNCDKAAAAMKSVIDRNRAALAGAAKLGQDEGKEQWLADQYGPRTEAAKSKLMPLMEKCADHEGIATVFDSIE